MAAPKQSPSACRGLPVTRDKPDALLSKAPARPARPKPEPIVTTTRAADSPLRPSIPFHSPTTSTANTAAYHRQQHSPTNTTRLSISPWNRRPAPRRPSPPHARADVTLTDRFSSRPHTTASASTQTPASLATHGTTHTYTRPIHTSTSTDMPFTPEHSLLRVEVPALHTIDTRSVENLFGMVSPCPAHPVASPDHVHA